jgi:hypothetical protein
MSEFPYRSALIVGTGPGISAFVARRLTELGVLDAVDSPDCTLDPDAIAQTYIDVLRQPRSAWSLEVELRPWVKRC